VFKFLMPPDKPGKVATFYMKGGHAIVVGNIKSVEMRRDATTGSYSGYSIEWEDVEKKPALFTLSIPDIVAVKVV
jgi:hypothetical protein